MIEHIFLSRFFGGGKEQFRPR